MIFPIKKNKYLEAYRVSYRILQLVADGYFVFFNPQPIEIVFCKEHNQYELLPFLTYEYDLFPWYYKDLHPRFSLLQIMLEIGFKNYNTIHRELVDLVPHIHENITKQEVTNIIRERYQKLLPKLNFTPESFLEYLPKRITLAKKIWTKLTKSQKQEIIQKNLELLKEDDKYQIYKLGNYHHFIFTKKMRLVREIPYTAYDLISIATPTELVQLTKRFSPHMLDIHGDILLKFLRNQITEEDFFREPNHEIRRILLEKLDVNKILSRMKKIAKDKEGELYEYQNTRYLAVKDSSTNELYLLTVPNEIKTPKEARKWTFRFYSDEKIKWIKET